MLALKRLDILAHRSPVQSNDLAEHAMRGYGTEALRAKGENYAVVSGCLEATAAAVDILKRGGNLVDAALAGSAVLCVVLPQAVVAVNATGAAPWRGTIDAYSARGHRVVPVAGPLSI